MIYLNIWDCTVSSYLSCLTPLTSDQKKPPRLCQQPALLHFLPSGHVETCFCGSGTSSCAKGPSEDTRDNKCMCDGVNASREEILRTGCHSQMLEMMKIFYLNHKNRVNVFTSLLLVLSLCCFTWKCFLLGLLIWAFDCFCACVNLPSSEFLQSFERDVLVQSFSLLVFLPERLLSWPMHRISFLLFLYSQANDRVLTTGSI